MPVHTIMYHYIRDNSNFNYELACCPDNQFRLVIEFLFPKLPFINPNDTDSLLFYLSSPTEHAFLLTFDDAYVDHLHACEFLSSFNIKPIIFACSNPLDSQFLLMNKIHLILGHLSRLSINPDPVLVEPHLKKLCVPASFYPSAASSAFISNPKRYDTPTVQFFKFYFQRFLPSDWAHLILDSLIELYCKDITPSSFISRLPKLNSSLLMVSNSARIHPLIHTLIFSILWSNISKSQMHIIVYTTSFLILLNLNSLHIPTVRTTSTLLQS